MSDKDLTPIEKKLKRNRDEIQRMTQEVEDIEFCLCQYPDLSIDYDRRKDERWFSKEANARATCIEMDRSCGCCHDTPLLVRPYVYHGSHRIYSDPPSFSVGGDDIMLGYDQPYEGWQEKMEAAGISAAAIGIVQEHFDEELEKRKSYLEEELDGM
jgi:hypothetical protein